jgi:hypothetical protein
MQAWILIGLNEPELAGFDRIRWRLQIKGNKGKYASFCFCVMK